MQAVIRTILALLAAGSVPVLHGAGYQGGAETTVGIDGGTIRDLTALLLALAATFFPQLTVLWKSLTNDPRVQELQKRLEALEQSHEAAKPAEATEAE